MGLLKLKFPVIANGVKQSRYKRLNLDCFVPRNDGDLYHHHSFLQEIFLMPGSRNDVLHVPSLRGTKQSRYKRLNLDCFVPRNDGDLYRHHSFLQGIFPMPGSRNDALQESSLRGGY